MFTSRQRYVPIKPAFKNPSSQRLLPLICLAGVIIIVCMYFINNNNDTNRNLPTQPSSVKSNFLAPIFESFKAPIFTDASIALFSINSNSQLEIKTRTRNLLNRNDIITIPVGASRMQDAMQNFKPRISVGLTVTANDNEKNQKIHQSNVVKYFRPYSSAKKQFENFEKYISLPNSEFDVVGTTFNTMYREMSLYRINSKTSPSLSGVSLLTNNEPGIILNHDSGFFKFRPDRIEIFAGIYPEQVSDKSFYRETILMVKNITVNQNGKANYFYIGTGQWLLDNPVAQLNSAFERLNILLMQLRSTNTNTTTTTKSPIVCVTIRLTIMKTDQLSTREKIGSLFSSNPISENYSLVYIPNLQGFWSDEVSHPTVDPATVSIDIYEMLFYILDSRTERSHFQSIVTDQIESYDVLCRLRWSDMFIVNPDNHSYRNYNSNVVLSNLIDDANPNEKNYPTTTISASNTSNNNTSPITPPRSGRYDNLSSEERDRESLYAESIIYSNLENLIDSSESETLNDGDDLEREGDNLEVEKESAEDDEIYDNLNIPDQHIVSNFENSRHIGVNKAGFGEHLYS